MKVLLLTYPSIGLNRGGLQIQLEKTATGLASLGAEAIFFNPWVNQIPDIDICHVFGVDGSCLNHVLRSRTMGKPVVVSPVLNLFNSARAVLHAKVLLAGLMPGMWSDLKRAKAMLKAANLVIALNSEERQVIEAVFNVSSDACQIVPNGIDLSFTLGDPTLFEGRYGVRGFVLEVASIERRKNQLTLVRAMRGLPYTLVLIGRVAPEQADYAEQLRRESSGNVMFLGALPHGDPLLASAYAAAKVFVLPSYSEVMPLTLYEAGLAGCQIVVSTNVPVADCIKPYISICDPDDVSALRTLVVRAMEERSGDDLLSQIRAMPSWDDVCRNLLSLYESLVQDSDRITRSWNG